MPQPTFFIYDYETFGIRPAADRPAQFAGIRTDPDFNPVADPVILYCKQTNDYLPSPESVLITGITPQECNQKGIPEPEFAAWVCAEFSQPNTCIMGYNNIRYDDEITRHTFYRNFLDPYEYSYQNNNSRWDLLDVVRACHALRPEGIEWPRDENNLPVFRLEQLTAANGIEHARAHDALSDVYATIALAKLVKQKQPRLFQFFFENRGKAPLAAMTDTARHTPLVHVSGMFGNARSNTALIAPLAWHPSNKNAVIACDLSADLRDLLNLNADTLRERLYTPKETLLAQGTLPVPLKLVHTNKCPILAPRNVLRDEDTARLGINPNTCAANLAALQNAPDIRAKVQEIFRETRQFSPSDNVETELYSGFFDHADKTNLATLRTLPPEQLAHHGLTFRDERIPKLLFHYRARHFYKTLTRAEQIQWQKYRRKKLEASLPAFSQSLQELAEQYADNSDKLRLLQAVYQYAERLLD